MIETDYIISFSGHSVPFISVSRKHGDVKEFTKWRK